jgi:hypothetical protein
VSRCHPLARRSGGGACSPGVDVGCCFAGEAVEECNCVFASVSGEVQLRARLREPGNLTAGG